MSACAGFQALPGASSLGDAVCSSCGHGALLHPGLPPGTPLGLEGCLACGLDASVARLSEVAAESWLPDLAPPQPGGVECPS